MEENLTTTYIICGCILFGLGAGTTAIPCMPEILDGIEMLYEAKRIRINEFHLHNMVSGYYVMFQGIGESVGPGAGALLSQAIDF